VLEVAGRPIVGWNLAWLARTGVRNVWINLHYRPEEIRHVVGDGSAYGVRVRYSSEDPILGTAGAWRNLAAEWSSTSLVVYGDNLVQFDLEAFGQNHIASGASATIALFDPDVHVSTRIAGGRVAMTANGQVMRFIEGTAPVGVDAPFVNAGVYLLEPDLLREIGPGFQDFGRDVLPGLAERGDVMGYVIEPTGYCLGLDTPECFRVAEGLINHGRVALT
jgi:NDP-sugar pyrophosphorylase family protein